MYTHYFPLKDSSNVNLTTVQKDVQAVLDMHDEIIQQEYDEPLNPINGFKDEDLIIMFNGIDGDGHETFYFDTSHTKYNFCKTARKPYDLVVCKVLLILKHHFQDKIELSSDGLKGEVDNNLEFIDDGGENWKEAQTWVKDYLNKTETVLTNLQELKSKLESHISDLEDLIDTLPQKGITSAECQKIALINRLNDFYYTVNGLEENDLIPEK